ncbi:MAG: FtsX-like permease family protein [Ktedonobacterales bacterium]
MKKLGMYWVYATRSLLRGGQRSLLAIFCVAVGVMAIVALQLVSNAINTGLTGNVRALNGGDLAISSASAPLTASQVRYFDTLKAQGTITAYSAVESASGQAHAAGGWRFFQVDAVNPASFPLEGAPVFTQPGNGSLSGLLHGRNVVITTTLAQTLNLAVGDSFKLYAQDGRVANVTIAGIVKDTGLFRGSVLLVGASDYAALPGMSNSLTYTAIYADVPGHTDANATAAAHQIQGQFPLVAITTTKQALAGNKTQVQDVTYFLQIVGLLALLIGGVGIVNTVQVLLRRRRVEIAMLKTTGYQQYDLFALFGLETGLIGLIGGIVGALVGADLSFFVNSLMQASLQIALPTTIDWRTVGEGVLIGFLTALIFGLMPIAQASQVRPQMVLRELHEGANWRSLLLTGGLVALVLALFFLLALGVLQNTELTALAVGGTGAFLLVLGLVLGGVVALISRFPVVESLRWWYVAILLVALVGSAALTFFVPAFAVVVALVVVLGAVAVLPLAWKATVKMAMRNLGRQKARTVTTLIALYIGVFAVGVILVLGQNITDSLNSFLAGSNGVNAEIVANHNDKAIVERQLAQVSGVRRITESPITQAVPVAINGQPIGAFVQHVTAGNSYTGGDVAGVMKGVQGYDLAQGSVPNNKDIPIVAGSHDANAGRNLTSADAGTLNALLPQTASQAPTNLKLGAKITLISQADKTPITLTVVGFYNTPLPQLEPILVDGSVVNTLSANAPQYGFTMHLDSRTADTTLATIENAAPGIVTFSLADFVDQYAQLLNSLVQVLIAVTSLAMLASVIIIANAVALAMLERRRELGILKSVGYTSRSVLSEVLIENGVVGLTGGLLAMLVVAVVAAVLGKFAFNLPIAIPVPTALGVVAATAVICMLVAALVAWRPTRVRPVEVLRYE